MAGIETVGSGQSVAIGNHSSSHQKSSHGYLLSLPMNDVKSVHTKWREVRCGVPCEGVVAGPETL